MKSMWKICAVLGCIALGILAASGCGNQDTANTENDSRPTITWTAWLGAMVEDDAEMIAYWNEKFGVNIEVWNIEPQSYDEVIGLKVAGGEIPDVLRITQLSNYQKYAKDGVIMQFSEDDLKKNAAQLYDTYIEYEPNAFKYRYVNGQLYGIPSLNQYYRRPLVYRGDWMEKLGVTKTPETLDEFEDLMYRFALEDPDGNGEKDTYGLSNSGLKAVFGAYGLSDTFWTKAEDGSLVYSDIQPEMKEALAKLRQWYADKVLDPEFIMEETPNTSSNISKPFVTGQIGFTANGEYWHYKPQFAEAVESNDVEGDNRRELRKLNPEAADKIVMGMPLTGPYGKSGIDQKNAVDITGDTYGFGIQLKDDPEKFAKILEIINEIGFSTYDNYLTAAYGIKGEHWDYNDKNQIVFTNPELEKYTERAKMGAHTVMSILVSPKWGNVNKEYITDWIAENGLDKGGIKNELATILPSESRYSTDLNKLCTETYIAIITGEQPLDYFDTFVEKWKTSGGDTLTEEANAWYNGVFR